MELFDAIYHRKSVRKYSNESLDEEQIDKIKIIINKTEKLYKDIDMDVHIIKNGKKIQQLKPGIIGSYGNVISPHYLLVTSEEKEGYLENIGYTLEKIILTLTTLGIGTCWIGSPFKKTHVKDIISLKENHNPIILVSFGNAQNKEELYRNNIINIKRKDFSELTLNSSNNKWKEIVAAARIAPSAMNSQPWRFVLDNNAIHLYRINPNIITKNFIEELNKIDMGICLSHIEIASKHFNNNLKIVKLPNEEIKGYNYFTSLIEI